MKKYIELGAYVTGRVKRTNELRQGVLIGYTPFHRAAIIEGERNTYLCHMDFIVVPDENLPDYMKHYITELRKELIQ